MPGEFTRNLANFKRVALPGLISPDLRPQRWKADGTERLASACGFSCAQNLMNQLGPPRWRGTSPRITALHTWLLMCLSPADRRLYFRCKMLRSSTIPTYSSRPRICKKSQAVSRQQKTLYNATLWNGANETSYLFKWRVSLAGERQVNLPLQFRSVPIGTIGETFLRVCRE
jgi:hypothetical protein